MDDEIKWKQLSPKSYYLNKPPESPYLGIEDMTTGTLDKISDLITYITITIILSKLIFANKSFCFKYTYDMFNVESSSDASCNRTDQFIRAQVQKQSPEWSNRHTWTHINPVVNWNHEGFQTNLHTTKITVIQHNKPHVTSISQVVHKHHIHQSTHSCYKMSSQIAEAK